jgi:hypothetical protein
MYYERFDFLREAVRAFRAVPVRRAAASFRPFRRILGFGAGLMCATSFTVVLTFAATLPSVDPMRRATATRASSFFAPEPGFRIRFSPRTLCVHPLEP